MNSFDRVLEGEENWLHGHRSLPPTPEQHTTASLRFDLKKLKDAISMPAPRQKTMDVVEGRRSDSLDELLANFEFARIKEYVERRRREAAQGQVTVTPDDTVQHCSPCSPDPEPSSDLCIKFESNEGKMGPELEELKSSSAGTDFGTPGQQCPPNEGIWEQGRTTANGFLTAGVGSSQGGRIPSTTECEDTKTFADTSSTAATPENRRRKTPSEQNKQFDPGGKGKTSPPWNVAVTLLSFSGESWEATCLFSPCVLSLLCVCSVS